MIESYLGKPFFLGLSMVTVLAALGCSSSGCGNSLTALWSGGQCGDQSVMFSSRHVGTASCSGVASTRKVDITCTKGGSGSNFLCANSAGADGAGYFVVLMPFDGSGQFNDTSIGAVPDCATLWSAMVSANLPSDLVGIYYADTSTGDGLSCPNSDTGCSHLSNQCISGWDLNAGGATGIAAILPAATQYYACAFIDTPLPGGAPAGGLPPAAGSGVLGLAASTQLATVTIGVNVVFSTWVNY